MALSPGTPNWIQAWEEAVDLVGTPVFDEGVTPAVSALSVMDGILLSAVISLQASGFGLLASLPTYMQTTEAGMALDAAFEAAFAESQALWISTQPPAAPPPQHTEAGIIMATFRTTFVSSMPVSTSGVGMDPLVTAVGNNIFAAYPSPPPPP